MFSLVSGVYDSYFAPTQLNLLVVGASGTGKTALLERLKVTQFTKKPKPPKEQPEELDVPESFLPVSLRVPKTELTKLQKQISSQSLQRKKKQNKKAAGKKEPKRRSFLACPAPAKYQKAEESSSEEEDDDDDDVNAEEAVVPPKPPRNGMGRNSSMDMSLEDVPIGESETSLVNGKDSSEKDNNKNPEPEDDDEEDEDQEFDLRPKHRMLPLHKIRPTIGQNLGKVEMCGAQCKIWDVGGKMHDLWSRYYPDADAVVFVWKIVDDNNPTEQSERNDDDSEDDWPPVTAAEQLKLLESVRSSIPDDVPFLIWGHWYPPAPTMKKPKAYQYNEPYSTGALLPHYHNPLMRVQFGSAKSSAGVRTAMEWLIPTAARQKKFRVKTTEGTEEDATKK